ncbi:serine/threonine-protein phosphatase 6 regulatory subunit 3 isoform X2 [Nematostella vectensis]|uniref:serine/threonine-protein phosphatase 6 regulatory subunit 3 isoform X2 n=1 Tax=Nematostella vectensis TaxID=45351 RepID=UPI0020776C9F|nr:serine/threonine-protein phosphatase 6 regulatory subunit 3 isoform X2 [Nematostella vectensis]
MFWKFDLHPSTAIDSILSKEDCTLIEILDEDDVLQETKSQNRKLIDFFVRPEILEELVNLIIKEPEEDFDEKLRYKHPNTACEVLTSDVFTIIDKMTASEELLNKLWSFLDHNAPLNPLLASFFSKVIGMLITRKTSQMIDFLRSKENFVELIIKHMGTSAIMDLVLRLITSVESPQLRQEVLEWLNEHKLVEGLVSLIDPEEEEDKNSNAAQTLNDIIRLSRDHMTQLQEGACQDPLLDAVQRRDTISSLLDHMFNGIKNHNDSAMVNGVFVLLTLLEVKRGMGEGEEPMTALDAERLAQGVSATLAAVTPRLKDFHDLLSNPPLMKPMTTTVGILDPPLGNARLQIAKLLSSILGTNSDSINQELASLGTMSVLWELFFKYSWNNFLHTQVEQCICTILNNPPTEEDGETHTPLVDSLFKDCNFLEKIMAAWEEPDHEITESQAKHRGYMGHLTNIANHVVHAREKGKNKDILETVFNDLPEKQREKWGVFVTGTLAEINKTNTSELVGHHPLQSSSDDDDDYKPIPFLHSESSLQQVFSNYQMQQMTADFMDTFGLDGDDFQEPNEGITAPFDKIGDLSFNINANEDNPNSALFEACCNERIQQFDDSGSDEEDVWEEKELTFSSVVEGRKSTLSESDSESSDEEEEEESPRQHSISSSSSDDDRIVFSDESPQSSPIKQRPPSPPAKDAVENKMDVDTSESWNAFEPPEVPMDDTVAMDASDVGWANVEPVPASETDTGWANFDSFTDIGMAASNPAQQEERPDSPVAMETESSFNPASSAASAYVIKNEESSTDQQKEPDLSKGLVLDANVFDDCSKEATPSETTGESSAGSSLLSERAAKYSCAEGADPASVPLASNESDDDISDDDDTPDDKSSGSPCKKQPVSPSTPNTTTSDTSSSVLNTSRGEVAANSPTHPVTTSAVAAAGQEQSNVSLPLDGASCHQAVNKKTRLDDSRPPLTELNETLANGPG